MVNLCSQLEKDIVILSVPEITLHPLQSCSAVRQSLQSLFLFFVFFVYRSVINFCLLVVRRL